MPARISQLHGRSRLRGLSQQTEIAGWELADNASRFDRLRDDDDKPRVVSSFNLFQTPEPLAARLSRMVNMGRVLEPSAGLGRLYRAVRNVDSDCHVTLVEQSEECCEELEREISDDHNSRLVRGDFLACDPATLGLFDSVVMNPPFKQGCDVRHILHAATFVADGGRLVAICAAGPRQRDKLQAIASQWIDLPAGSFREAGTNVNAAIVVIEH